VRPEALIVVIAGLHGVGKSVLSKALAERFGLRRVSAGEMFRRMARERGEDITSFSESASRDESIDREIDVKVVQEALKGGVVVDSLLAAWFLKEKAHIKVYLKAPLEERVKRIAMRDGKSVEEAKRETLIRETSERDRFKRYYGVDIDDLSVYDLVINTSLADEESLKRALIQIVEGYLKTH